MFLEQVFKELKPDQQTDVGDLYEKIWDKKEPGLDGTNFFERIFGKEGVSPITRHTLVRKYNENPLSQNSGVVSIQKPITLIKMLEYLEYQVPEEKQLYAGNKTLKAEILIEEFEKIYPPYNNQSKNDVDERQNEKVSAPNLLTTEFEKTVPDYIKIHVDSNVADVLEALVRSYYALIISGDKYKAHELIFYQDILIDGSKIMFDSHDKVSTWESIFFIMDLKVWDIIPYRRAKDYYCCKVFFTEYDLSISEKDLYSLTSSLQTNALKLYDSLINDILYSAYQKIERNPFANHVDRLLLEKAVLERIKSECEDYLIKRSVMSKLFSKARQTSQTDLVRRDNFYTVGFKNENGQWYIERIERMPKYAFFWP